MVTNTIRAEVGIVVGYNDYHGDWFARGFNGSDDAGYDTKTAALKEAESLMREWPDAVGILVTNREGRPQRFEADAHRVERALYTGEMFGAEGYVVHPRHEIDYPGDYGNWGVGKAQGEDLLNFKSDIKTFDTKSAAMEWAKNSMERNRKVGVFEYTQKYTSTFHANLGYLINQVSKPARF